MKKKILVTGAGGYVGSVLVPKLIKSGFKVIAYDRFFFGVDKLKNNNNLTIIKRDIRNFDESLLKNIYAVIDLAAISNDPSSEFLKIETKQINYKARFKLAKLSKKNKVKKYILPSSCSIYGFSNKIVDENSTANPQSIYAKANYDCEIAILSLANADFCVTVMRQPTLYGFSPRMRFDLAVNGMTYGAWLNKKLPLLRNGKQFRPILHVKDTSDFMIYLLNFKNINKINKNIFNVGDNKCNYQLNILAQKVKKTSEMILKTRINIEWYGDTDTRSYKVNFDKINKILDWKPKVKIEKGIEEIIKKLNNKKLIKNEQTITLDWYKELIKWNKIINDISNDRKIF